MIGWAPLFGILAGCGPSGLDTSHRDSADKPPAEPPYSVFLITVDTVRAELLSPFYELDTTPNLAGFYDQATTFTQATAPRGLTPVAMATFLTGFYPRSHGVREPLDLRGGWKGAVPLLAQRFNDAGYDTHAFVSTWTSMAVGFDHTTVTPAGSREIPTVETDLSLVKTAYNVIERTDRDTPVFVWVHLLTPHDPYEAAEPWFSERVDPDYRGLLYDDRGRIDTQLLSGVALGNQVADEADEAYLEAVYTSELNQIDEQLGLLFGHLKKTGDWHDSVIAVGFDHGETLLERDDYAFHGCSLYEEVINVPFSFRAPGADEPRTIEAPVSTADVAPTLIELAGLTWAGDRDGHSLASAIYDGVVPERDVFFSRVDSSIGIRRGDWKYVLAPGGTFNGCAPFETRREYRYEMPEQSLHDLATDPHERDNLVETEVEKAAELRAAACAYVTSAPWSHDTQDDQNELVTACTEG